MPDPIVDAINSLRADVDSLLAREFMRSPVSGTWTPAFVGTTIAGAFTYDVQHGVYTQIAGWVFILGRVRITAIGTPPTGNMYISGLPVTSRALYNYGISFAKIHQFNYSAGALALTGLIGNGDTNITLLETFDNAPAVAPPAANFTNTACELVFTGQYLY